MKYLLIMIFLSASSFAEYDCRVLNPDTSADPDTSYRVYGKTVQQCQKWFSENVGSFKCVGVCIWGEEDKTAEYEAERAKVSRVKLLKEKLDDETISHKELIEYLKLKGGR